jgi:hypothetical protein
MEKKYLSRVIGASVGLFLGGWLIVNLALSMPAEPNAKEKFDQIHAELSKISVSMAQNVRSAKIKSDELKRLTAELETLTNARIELNQQENNLIQEPFKSAPEVAETTPDVWQAIESMPDTDFFRNDDFKIIPTASASDFDPSNLEWQLSILDLLDQNKPQHLKIEKLLKKEYCYKKDIGLNGQKHIFMASLISGNDLQFLATLQGENGEWTKDRKHDDGIGFGFCGMSRPWHNDDIDNPLFFASASYQLKVCYDHFKDGTTFYANTPAKIAKNSEVFVCPSE